MNSEHLKDLIDKYLSGNCTPEEKQLLESLYDQELASRTSLPGDTNLEAQQTQIWDAIQTSVTMPPRVMPYRRWLAAASIIGVIVTAAVWLLYQQPKTSSLPVLARQKSDTLIPAREQAMLTLADGSRITLDDASKGELSKQAGQSIVKLKDGSLAYSPKDDRGVRKEIIYNTLSTPRASHYQLTLADGSKFWLNAASSITYPASFAANERVVSITGEVYCEIAKDPARPFVVKTDDQIIRVLGTHFNVMAYPDESNVVTTLLEGSVSIKHDQKEKIMKPGDQAMVDPAAVGIKLRRVNTEDAVAWKNGFFKFDNEPLGSIMKKISRWYDVDVLFGDEVEEKKFWGTYSRSNSLENLLNSLQQTDDVHFKITGRKITVTK